jgi:hypothetical protein
MNKEFIRVRSVRDLVTVALLIIIGSICIGFIPSQAVNVLGFFLLFAGLLHKYEPCSEWFKTENNG